VGSDPVRRMSIADIKNRLRAVIPGIDNLTMALEAGSQVYTVNGISATVGAFASDAEIETAIRAALGAPAAPVATPLPSVNITEQAKPVMTAPAPAQGSFAASIRAMMDEARAGVAQARADGLAKVSDAVGKLGEAKAATLHVAGTMAQTIEDEAASVMAELGQISNSLGGE
jgi:hypothetical protein